MKLSTVFAKLTCSRTKVITTLGGLAVAGAALTMTPAAQAQHFAVGVQFGAPAYVAPRPVYVAPAYGYAAPAYGYGYADRGGFDGRRAEAWREHEWRKHEWREHQAREYRRDFDRDRAYDRGGWR